MKATKLTACSLSRACVSAAGAVAPVASLLAGLLLPQGVAATGSCVTGESFKSGSTFINVVSVNEKYKPDTHCVRIYKSKREGAYVYHLYAKVKEVGERCPRPLGMYRLGENDENVSERFMKAVEGVICSKYRIIRPESLQPASDPDEAAQGSVQADGAAGREGKRDRAGLLQKLTKHLQDECNYQFKIGRGSAGCRDFGGMMDRYERNLEEICDIPFEGSRLLPGESEPTHYDANVARICDEFGY